MIQLVLVFCVAMTGQCVVVTPNTQVPDWHACILQAERVANQWKDDAPDWTLINWKCQRVNGEEDKPL